MSKLNHLLNAEKYSMLSNASEMGGDNVLKACPSIQWSLARAFKASCHGRAATAT